MTAPTWPPKRCIDCDSTLGKGAITGNPRCRGCHGALVKRHQSTFPKPPPLPKAPILREFDLWRGAMDRRARQFRHDVHVPRTLPALLEESQLVSSSHGLEYRHPSGCQVVRYNSRGRLEAYRRALLEGGGERGWANALQRDVEELWPGAEVERVTKRPPAAIRASLGEDAPLLWYDALTLIDRLDRGDDPRLVALEAQVPDLAVVEEIEDESVAEARPLVKWPGGKREYAPKILALLLARCPAPDLYVEPFAGGAAVFWALRAALSGIAIGDGSGQVVTPVLTPDRVMPQAVLSDACMELIDTYLAVAAEPEVVIRVHEKIRASYEAAWQGGEDRAEDWYYSLRNQHADLGKRPIAARAAWFLTINRAGFNGLWRVNRLSHCNVPWGRTPPARLLDPARIREASSALQETRIRCRDYREGALEATEAARAGQRVILFLDPPYPGTFDGYTASGFPMTEHEILADLAEEARAAGVTVAITINNTDAVRLLYPSDRWVLNEVSERRAINRDGAGRGGVKCLILVGRE